MARRGAGAAARGLLLLAAASGAPPAPGAAHPAAVARDTARRVEQGKASSESLHNVFLLVTRHGLSCTNVAQKWVGKFDFGRANIHDPLLSGAARSHARQARAAATEWLANRNLTMDAVVSSVLARAIQTALLTYPQGGSAPLYVVPYIREKGHGLSNTPKEQWEQVSDINRSLGVADAFSLDYHWMDIYGRDQISWPNFETFLEQSFLPTLIRDTGKPSGSPIVLGVVTHSNFVKASPLAEGCKQFWESRGETKMLNNQILMVHYMLKVAAPAPGSFDRTKRYSLDTVQPYPCEEVFSGASIRETAGAREGKLRELCFPDVGDDCHGPIKQHSLSPQTLYRKTREANMLENAEAMMLFKKGIQEDEAELASSTCKLWGENHPACQNGYANVARHYAMLNDKIKQLVAQRETECWSGHKPEVAKLCILQGLTWKAGDPYPCTTWRQAVAVLDLAVGNASAA